MRLIITIGIIALLAYFMQLMLPWWSAALAAFVVSSVLSRKGWNAFWSGFIGIFLLWFIHSLIIDVTTDSILTAKVAQLFFLPFSFLLIIIAAAIGGLTGGMAALTGYFLKRIIIVK